jgi:hypothetical protein
MRWIENADRLIGQSKLNLPFDRSGARKMTSREVHPSQRRGPLPAGGSTLVFLDLCINADGPPDESLKGNRSETAMVLWLLIKPLRTKWRGVLRL